MGLHLSPQELAAFLAGELPTASRRQLILKHLLLRCPSCLGELQNLERSERLPELLSRQLGGRAPAGWRSATPHVDYERAFEAAERSATLFLSHGRPMDEPPGALLAELGRLSVDCEVPPQKLSVESRALPALVLWLVAKSHSCRFGSPADTLQWALMARIAAQTCSVGIAGNTQKLADLRGRAEAQLANALRIVGRSEEAATTLRTAEALLERGTGDPELRASWLQKAASLLRFQDRLAEALDHIEEAEAILDRVEMRHERTKCDVLQAMLYNSFGEPDRAALLLERAQPVIDSVDDVTLPVVVRTLLIEAYRELGQPARAMKAYKETEGSKHARGGQLGGMLDWQGGLTFRDLGAYRAAEHTLLRARMSIVDQGLPLDIVLATFDLVRVQLHLGEVAMAEKEVAATAARFSSWTGGPEVVQALNRLQSLVS